MNKNVKKWEITGLLSGLSDVKKIKCARDLENMSLFLIKSRDNTDYDKEIKTLEKIATMIFPIIRRLYDTNIKSIPKTKKLFGSFLRYCITKYTVHSLSNNEEEKICCEYPRYLMSK